MGLTTKAFMHVPVQECSTAQIPSQRLQLIVHSQRSSGCVTVL